MIDDVLVEWVASIDGQRLYEQIITDLRDSQSKEQLVLTLAAFLSYHRLFPPNQPIKGSYQADFNAILSGESLSNARTVSEYMVLLVLRVFYTVKDNKNMRTFLAGVLDIDMQLPILDYFHGYLDQYWVCRLRDGLSHEDALAETVTEMVTLDNEVIPREEDSEHRVPFPCAVLHLDAYKLVYVCLPKVTPHEKILCTISKPNGSLVVIVQRLYISELEQDLGTTCFPYNVESSREDMELLGLVEAQNRQVDALARMAIDAMSRDNPLKKGLWVYAEPRYVFNLLTTWLGGVVRSKRDSPAFPELTRIENDPKLGRIQLDGYDFGLYTLVRVSDFFGDTQTLDELGNFDEILSIVELDDESWELPVRKSYLPTLKDKLRKIVFDCIIDSGYDPTEPDAKKVKQFGYTVARILSKDKFLDRAKHMRNEAFPKAAAFYSDLAIYLLGNSENEWDILGNEEKDDEEKDNEEIGCWVMV